MLVLWTGLGFYVQQQEHQAVPVFVAHVIGTLAPAVS